MRVVAYEDDAQGTTALHGGRIRFTEVLPRPKVTIDRASNPDAAPRPHEKAYEACFIANSVNFPVRLEPSIVIAS